MNINNSYDRHLDPPDDDAPEQEYCEYCGQEMEYHCDNVGRSNQEIWWKCTNKFCPERFEESTKTVMDMSNRLAEVEQELSSTWSSLSFVRRKLALTEGRLVEREGTIEDLELKLTPSQSKEVVRDKDYQITRMEDSLECLKECSNWDNFYEEFALVEKEWAEVKKILNYGK